MWTRFRNDTNLGSRSAVLVKATGLLSAVVMAWSMALAPAANAHEDLQALVKDIMPAVVSITVNLGGSNRVIKGVGGSGLLISSNGMVVTNYHAIENAEDIKVKMNSGESFTAEVVGSDPNTGMALLQVVDFEGTVFPLVPFGNSDDAEVGDTVIASGNPFGIGISVTSGILSAIDHKLGDNYDNYILTDAAINFGISDEILFNEDGEVIVANTAIVFNANGEVIGVSTEPGEGGMLGFGFAMKSNVVKDFVDGLREQGQIRPGWLGVGIQSVTDDMRGAIGVEDLTGALVSSVLEGAPAERAGIVSGDIITEFDGIEVGDAGELTRLVGKAVPGKEATLTIWRNGEILTLEVVLDERVEEELASLPSQAALPGIQPGQ